ncbi:granzyme G isoform X1 [Fundulus heteroclitus]|uniref:granzyme G isoform X1 n=1 Tax=Fundulus heteroclitus TaxID=8078 RepID=UPI00165B9401|nr:granzyme G isoform X1 [Fundulus heteroclitus]
MFIYCTQAVLMLVLTFQRESHAGRVLGGHEVVPHSRPYVVLLKTIDQNDTPNFCGGFLITEDFVVTAAHCKAKSYKVIPGLHQYNERHILSVKENFVHNYYNENDYTNDIMLLKLSSKAVWNDKVKPIALADQQGNSLPTLCTVCGWGPTSSKETHMSSTLMEASVTLINNELCVKENVYCSEGDKGPSKGDSGGPLVCEDGKAYGVVSASQTTNGSMLYKYTKIKDNIDWINNIIRNN